MACGRLARGQCVVACARNEYALRLAPNAQPIGTNK